MTIIRKECKRCGTCCTKGGPALHTEDLGLLKNGVIHRGNLITIRKGELVYKPFQDFPHSAACELVKICGIGGEWQCYFFDGEGKGCAIYDSRPLSCRELECWNTSAVENLVEQDTITRFDIISADEPICRSVQDHEKECPSPEMGSLYEMAAKGEFPRAGEFDQLINRDIEIRTAAVTNFKITLAEELFYFGRPLFQQLQQLGGRVTESSGVLRVTWPR